MRHVFVSVVRSNVDHFYGIKQKIIEENLGDIIEVSFSDQDFDHIKNIEYSDRRFFRLFYYPGIFRNLIERLDAALQGLGERPANVYFTDEGVWALVWAAYRRRFPRGQVVGINVQHGFALVRPTPFPRLRRVLNAVSRCVSGFPTIGYGSLGGAGPEPFDAYLTYDDASARHIEQNTGMPAVAVPLTIKYALLSSFETMRERGRRQGGPRVLFALNINMRGSPVRCDTMGMYDQLMPFAATLKALGGRLTFRLHPGLDAEIETRRFVAHPIAQLSDLDDSPSLQHSLARSDMVLSLLSTVLWEAALLDLVAVQVKCACCDDVELGYAREILSLDNDYVEHLKKLLDRSARPDRGDWRARQSAEWAAVRPLLAIDRATS